MARVLEVTAASLFPTRWTRSSASSPSGMISRGWPGSPTSTAMTRPAGRRDRCAGRWSRRSPRWARTGRPPRRAVAARPPPRRPGQVGDVDPGLGIGAPPHADHQQPAVVGHLGLVAPLGLVGRREDDEVICRIGAEAVVAELHVQVRRVVGRVHGRFGVAAVEEPGVVVGPRRRGELAPRDPVGQILTCRDPPNRPGVPVGARVARGAGDELAALGNRGAGEGRRPLPAQEVRVEEHLALIPRPVRHPEHVLVLEARVPELEPAIATAPRRARPRMVPELRQPVADRVSGRQPGEHARRQLVLGRDPDPGRRRVGVLERAVRVGDRGAVVVIDLVGGRRRGVGHRPVHPRHPTGCLHCITTSAPSSRPRRTSAAHARCRARSPRTRGAFGLGGAGAP